MTDSVAIITARGGSKRIPRKNIRDFMGKPMIAWPITAVRECGLFSRIIVSTDDVEIAAVARRYGAETPFIRPSVLADDHTPTASVLEHALCWLQVHDVLPRFACCIYPTAPFLHSDDLMKGYTLLCGDDSPPCVLSVSTFPFPILRALKICDDGTVAFNWPEHASMRSQDLPEFLHDAGQFYWVDTKRFLRSGNLLMPGSRSVQLPRSRVQDLDTLEDWEVAENMAKVLLNDNK